MDWGLYDKDGNFIEEAFCKFDSLDFALDRGAIKVVVDLKNRKTFIVEFEDE